MEEVCIAPVKKDDVKRVRFEGQWGCGGHVGWLCSPEW